MINQINFINNLKTSEVEFISGVPDTLLNDFCLSLDDNWDKDKHVIAANEGNSISMAAGYYLSTGTIPLVYMQNSGIGNCVNPLLSLTHKGVYSIPMILLIGWRGDPGRKDHPQHTKQGAITTVLLDNLDIPYRIIEADDAKALEDARWAVSQAKKSKQPVALIARKGIFEKGEKDSFPKDDRYELTREDAIRTVVETLPADTIYVASTGRTTRELHAIRKMRQESHANDFLNVGAMGHTSSIALGVAIAKNDKLVVCLEGDASAIMHLGAFTTIGKEKPSNLLHIILNNGVHESVGGQKSAGHFINLTEIAKNSGYTTLKNSISNSNELIGAINRLISDPKPKFIDLHIQKGIRDDMPLLKINHIDSKIEFMNNLTLHQ
jgi:phosphonopyruvate decarboxylase